MINAYDEIMMNDTKIESSMTRPEKEQLHQERYNSMEGFSTTLPTQLPLQPMTKYNIASIPNNVQPSMTYHSSPLTTPVYPSTLTAPV